MKILVAKEKHATRYLRASTDAELHRSALTLLDERYREGYWYYRPEALKLKTPAMTLEAAEALPAGDVKTLALKEHRLAKSHRQQYEREVADYAAIEAAVKAQDGKAAWAILRSRRDNEYEDVCLEELE